MQQPTVISFFDEATFTASYIVQDPDSNKAAIIDSVLDFDPKSGRTNTESADEIIAHVKKHGLEVEWILETHAHADHLTAAPYLKKNLGGKTAIGEHIKDVQTIFRDVFNLEKSFLPDGSQFDHLFNDADTFMIGGLKVLVMHTPGHTPACISYIAGDAAFVGDTLFMPDAGTARADFPGGDAHTLFHSTQKILALPDETRIFLCHDYGADGKREIAYTTTVKAEREANIHVGAGKDEAAYIKMREARDATLGMPTLILPSIQVNIRAGELPPAEDNGVRYMKLPIDAL
ncbi:MAG: MBL fold metallo-hydrolase [Alphaproteobacteria bacterium]